MKDVSRTLKIRTCQRISNKVEVLGLSRDIYIGSIMLYEVANTKLI